MADMHDRGKEILELIERGLGDQDIPRDAYLRFVFIRSGGTFDLAGIGPLSGSNVPVGGDPVTAAADMESSVQSSIALFRDTRQSLRRLHEESGGGYLSGGSEPDGMDVYIAHRQGLAGYQSIQHALEEGKFSRPDTRGHLMSDIDRRALATMTDERRTGFSGIPDADLASSYLRYWQDRFAQIPVPERNTVFADVARDANPGGREVRSIEMRAAYDLLAGSDSGVSPPGMPMVNSGAAGEGTWMALAQNATMTEINQATGHAVFSRADRFRPGYQGPADMIDASVRLGGTLLESEAMTADALKPGMFIGERHADSSTGGIDGISMVLRVPDNAELRVARACKGSIKMVDIGDYLSDCRDNAISLCAVDPLAKARDLIHDRQWELAPSLSQEAEDTPAHDGGTKIAQADPAHPDHALFQQACRAWGKFCDELKQGEAGREPQASIIAANLATAARNAGLSGIDHVMQNRDGSLVAIVQGELDALDQQRVYVARDQALTGQIGVSAPAADSLSEVVAPDQCQETKPRGL